MKAKMHKALGNIRTSIRLAHAIGPVWEKHMMPLRNEKLTYTPGMAGKKKKGADNGV